MATGKRQDFAIDPHAHQWRAPKDRHGTLAKQLGIEFYGARARCSPAPAKAVSPFFPTAPPPAAASACAPNAARDIDVAWLTGEVKVTRGEAR